MKRPSKVDLLKRLHADLSDAVHLEPGALDALRWAVDSLRMPMRVELWRRLGTVVEATNDSGDVRHVGIVRGLVHGVLAQLEVPGHDDLIEWPVVDLRVADADNRSVYAQEQLAAATEAVEQVAAGDAHRAALWWLLHRVNVELGNHSPDEPAELPMVTIEDDVLVCPVCGTRDEIYEQDSDIRFNQLFVGEDGLGVSAAQTNYGTDRFCCKACDSDVDLPHTPTWT